MRYVCDTCFALFPSGSIGDIPGTVLPTISTVCTVCKTLVTPGIELTGHMVPDKLPTLHFIPISGNLGSQPVSGSR